MWSDAFLRWTQRPSFRRVIWRPAYNLIAQVVPTEEFRFMNYGYAPDPGDAPIRLEDMDAEDLYCIQLYYQLARKVDLTDKDVLEVGSGRGGGSSFLYRHLKPASMTGLDISDRAVVLANLRLAHGNLTYLQGNAESLPFGHDRFHVVINVESSHAYGSVETFVSEVWRVLRPGGIFLITDMRTPEDLKVLRQTLIDSGMEMVEEKDITRNVVRAIELDHDHKMGRIRRLVPAWLIPVFREFAGIRESAVHRHLRDGQRVYHWWVLRKPLYMAA